MTAERVMTELRQFGADCEITLDELIAVDVPAGSLRAVEAFLVRGKEAEQWGLQDGYVSGDSGTDGGTDGT